METYKKSFSIFGIFLMILSTIIQPLLITTASANESEWEMEYCNQLTMVTGVDGVDISVHDQLGNKIAEGVTKNKKVVLDGTFEKGNTYYYLATKDGYQSLRLDFAVHDCEIEVPMYKVQETQATFETCDELTFNLNVFNAYVELYNYNGDLIGAGYGSNGVFKYKKPHYKGSYIRIVITKEGYKKYEKELNLYDCENNIVLEADESKKDVCTGEELTVNTNQDGAKVTVTNKNGTLVGVAISKDKKAVVKGNFKKGNDYLITIEKEGFETNKSETNYSNCVTTIDLKEVVAELETCKQFTVKVNVDGANIKIKDYYGNTLAEGQSKNGKFVTDYPLEDGNGYEMFVSKLGYHDLKHNFNVHECEETVELKVIEPTKPDTCDITTIRVDNADNVKLSYHDGKVVFNGKPKANAVKLPDLVDGSGYILEVTGNNIKPIKENINIVDCEYTVKTEPKEEKIQDKLTFKINTKEKNNFTLELKTNNTTLMGETKNNSHTFNHNFTADKFKELKVYDESKDVVYKLTSLKGLGQDSVYTIDIDSHLNLKYIPKVTLNFDKTYDEVKVINRHNLEVFNSKKESNKVVLNDVLVKGTYKVIAKKNGYYDLNEVLILNSTKDTSKDFKFKLVEPENKYEVCDNFVVTSNVDGAKVELFYADRSPLDSGEIKKGKFSTKKTMEVGNGYIVRVSKEGYTAKEFNFNIYDCNLDVNLNKIKVDKPVETKPEEKPTQSKPETKPEEKPKEDLTISMKEVVIDTNKKGTHIVVTNVEGKEMFSGKTDSDGKLVIEADLNLWEDYLIKATKSGYKTIEETVRFVNEVESYSIPMKKKSSGGGGSSKNICTEFTIFTNVSGANVTILDSIGTTVSNGKTDRNGAYEVSALEDGKKYTLIIEKGGHKKYVETLVGDEYNCNIKVDVEEVNIVKGFQITSDVDSADVKVYNELDTLLYQGKLENGYFEIEEDLVENRKYNITLTFGDKYASYKFIHDGQNRTAHISFYDSSNEVGNIEDMEDLGSEYLIPIPLDKPKEEVVENKPNKEEVVKPSKEDKKKEEELINDYLIPTESDKDENVEKEEVVEEEEKEEKTKEDTTTEDEEDLMKDYLIADTSNSTNSDSKESNTSNTTNSDEVESSSNSSENSPESTTNDTNNNSNEPTTDTVSTDSESNVEQVEPNVVIDNGNLPQTNTESSSTLKIVLGVILILVGIGATVFSRKRQS